MLSKKYLERERVIEVIDEVDVLVISGGPAGMGAAIGAAREGASAMIIEAVGSFGGMWTNGLVIILGGFNSWLRPYKRCVDGVMGEWPQLAEMRGGAVNNRSSVLNFDPEIMGAFLVGATCGGIGHAAGVAVAISARENVTPRQLKVTDVQQELIRQKGIIDI